MNAGELAKPALDAVHSGETTFVPKTWEKTYFNWMENIQPWCVSRQLWWGHQIPAWYGAGWPRASSAETEAEAQAQAGAGVTLTRDEDVLDTWFSSGALALRHPRLARRTPPTSPATTPATCWSPASTSSSSGSPA